MFVYLVTNKINGKQYVGQHSGNDLQAYWGRCVIHALNGNHGRNRLLYRAIRKYGKDNFTIAPLVVVNSKWEMDRYEIGLIKAWDLQNKERGYNLAAGGQGTIGYKFSEEDLRRLSIAHMGLKQSDETKEKRARRIRGIKRSEETKRKMSEAQKGNRNCLGRRMSDENRAKLSLINLGNSHATGAVRSLEYRKKLSDIFKGRPLSEHHVAALKVGSHNRHHTRKGIVNPNCKLCQEPNE